MEAKTLHPYSTKLSLQIKGNKDILFTLLTLDNNAKQLLLIST